MQKISIKTERLQLQPLNMSHLSGVIRYGMDEQNAQMMMNLPFRSKEEVAMYICDQVREWEKEQPLQLAFAVLCDGDNIGMVDAYLNDDLTEAELGWIIDKRHWGNGYAVEAANGVIALCRQFFGIKRYFALCDSENRASTRVMEKLGMQPEGIIGVRYNRSGGGMRMESRYGMTLSDEQ